MAEKLTKKKVSETEKSLQMEKEHRERLIADIALVLSQINEGHSVGVTLTSDAKNVLLDAMIDAEAVAVLRTIVTRAMALPDTKRQLQDVQARYDETKRAYEAYRAGVLDCATGRQLPHFPFNPRF